MHLLLPNKGPSDRFWRSYVPMIGKRCPHSTDVKRQEEDFQNDPKNNSEIVMEIMHHETVKLNDAVSGPPHESCD